jgi:glycosyltransferase involved in cell wall biosynthesis
MRRIVHYYPDAMGNSGVTFALWAWARAQVAAGFEVSVLHATAPNLSARTSFVSKELCSGLSASCIAHRGRHRLTLRPVDLDRHLGRNDLLVLHEGWVPSNMCAAAAARRAQVPYVVMPHGVYERAWTNCLKGPRWLRDRLERRVLERAAAVHVFFGSEISDIAALAPGASFLTVPTGYEVPIERWIGGGGYVGWIGRVDPVHKGLDLLVGAIARLAPADRPLMRMCGYDYKGGIDRLQAVIDEHRVGRWVRLEGVIAGADKTRFLQLSDGYVHPSRWECHSIALLENLALGVPCLVSNAIHIAQTLARSSAAVLTRLDEGCLASALLELGDDRARVAARGRALIADTFNWSTLMPQFGSALGRLGLA